MYTTWQRVEADIPAKGLFVVDEAKVSRLTDETLRLTCLHTGLALLRYEKPEGAKRRPGRWSSYIGRPAMSCRIGQGHEQRPRNPGATSRRVSGEVGCDQGRLGGAEVLKMKERGQLFLHNHFIIFEFTVRRVLSESVY